jgi:calcineurin-like phosphoesterase family protein
MMTRNTFFTSDWHIGHQKVLELDNRPYKDLNHMNQVLIGNFNSTVRHDDITYFLGDIGMCKGSEIKSVITRLNGTKICILGNHDAKRHKMSTLGFDAVLNSGSLVIAGELVTMSHCPLRGVFREDTSEMNGPGGNWHKEEKHGKHYSVTDEGQFHLHGHIHSPNGGKSTLILGRQYDVGVCNSSYRPVASSIIESWIAKVLNEEKKST